MSAPETPSNTQPHKRPWGWIALAGLLTVGVVALAIYAVNLNSDLDDANAKVASQQEEIDQAQDKGAGVAAAAKLAYEELSGKLGAARRTRVRRSTRRRSSWTTLSRRRQMRRAAPTSSRSRSTPRRRRPTPPRRARSPSSRRSAASSTPRRSRKASKPPWRSSRRCSRQCAPALGESS